MTPLLCACFAVASFVAALVQDPAAPRTPELLDNAALQARLAGIAKAHPECAALLPIGFSRAHAEIDVLRLSNGEPKKGQPAIFVVANIDGPQTFSSVVALAHVEALAEGFASDEKIGKFLSSTTLYVLARANPDAAAARFAKPLFELEATGSGVDDDRDRREGEDPPSDVDGDGVIAWMRWKDPEGAWIAEPTDARVMVKADAKKGQLGAYKLALEGRDLDHDETPSEDSAHDAVVNQNFPHEWQEHGAHAGRYPMDEPEARAIADFMLLHKDIALVVTYGTLDTLVEKAKSVGDNAPSQKRIPPAGWLESDAGLLGELSKRYGEITSNKTKGRGVENGSFQAWVYQHRGLWSLAIPLWDIPTEAKKKESDAAPPQKPEGDKTDGDKTPPAAKAETTEGSKPSEKESGKPQGKPGDKPGEKSGGKDDAKNEDVLRLKWVDSAGEGARFLPWKSFAHPELGEVEIGGFAPFARSEPPRAEWATIAKRELDFLLSLGADLPRVAISRLEAKRLSPGLIEVKAALLNDALLPVSNKAGLRADASRPLRVKLVLPDGAQLVGGSLQTLVRDLGGKARKELRWLVLCDQPLQIGVSVDSDNAGEAQAMTEVKK
ncbi:MAG TPA: M14 family zinc carboxypeptidase [Planctomycetota bacterium]|nr:M14 family zinc carboxypeptidase [Planctomycetota bacterium]